MQSSWDAPTPAQLTYLDRAEAELRKVLDDFNKVFAEDVTKYQGRSAERNRGTVAGAGTDRNSIGHRLTDYWPPSSPAHVPA